jgi:tetratricopeptide (TPR) repeat protein
VNALLTWRETGAIAWRKGAWRAVDERLLGEGVPGVAALVEARLTSYFAPNSPIARAALRALGAVALHGGGLAVDTILHIGGKAESLEDALEALVDAGILVVSGERQEYGFAQEMVRQAVLNLVRQRSWFYRLHRTLLDAIAEGPDAAADAAFLSTGYEKLGARGKARTWLGRAMEGAIHAGLFDEAATFGDRLAALTEDPEARADVELAAVRALVQGRQFEEAKDRLERLDEGTGVPPSRDHHADVERRILRLQVARGRSEAAEDPALVEAADALGDPALSCKARMALAGVAPEETAMELIDEAVDLAERCRHALAFAARVLRVELIYAATRRDLLPKAERDLRRAIAIARTTKSSWQQIHIEGDLAVLEAELGSVASAIDRLRRLSEQADAEGMRGQRRMLLYNLATFLMREGRSGEAAEVAQQTADLAADAGDPAVRWLALSVRAYALFCTGDLDAALASASEAERLQRERDDRMRALTLIRRAVILEAIGKEDEALEDARAAEQDARRHEERGFFATAVLWQKLYLARRGEATEEEVREALSAVETSETGQCALAQRLLEQAEAWLAGSTAPMLP